MSRLARIGRYWHTLKHLKPVQFYGRLWFLMHRPRLDRSPAPSLRASRAAWQSTPQRPSSMTGSRSFRFLNEAGSLRAADWEEPSRSKLWLYNLHYFDDLNAERAGERKDWHAALMDDWIAHHPAGGTGWEPYPTSLRIVNWTKRHLSGTALTAAQCESMAAQARWLRQRLEWHLLGNHLFVNSKALVFAGLLFEGPEAARWLASGLSIIADELGEQVLPDGGNFERSPMYHAIFLEDLLDLINAAQVFAGQIPAGTLAAWHETAARMVRWLRASCHPDGEISLFNDAAIGVAPAPATLYDYATRLGVDVAAPAPAAIQTESPQALTLPDSGYVRVESAHVVAILDVAPVGPDYLPGHAHADTLSFEMSIFGQRVIVNGGTSRYGLGPERLRERGTAAHSTLLVDDQDSSEVWGGFRVARRARPFGLQVQTTAQEAVVSCAHDGYTRLPGHPVHRREWRIGEQHAVIRDHVEGGYRSAEARYHLHPSVRAEIVDARELRMTLPNGRQLHLRALEGILRLEPSRYAAAFGEVHDTQCAVVAVVNGRAGVEIDWT